MRIQPEVELVHRFFSGTGPTYDYMVHLCTLGFDRRWKQRIMQKIPSRPARIIDQACGTGILTFKIARRFPDCEVIGVELREEYLDIARKKSLSRNGPNLKFLLGRAEEIVLKGQFDCITSSYLAKYALMGRLVANARRMLRKGGVVVMHDFIYPVNPHFALLWETYFRLLQHIGGRIYPEWRTIFHELPELLRRTQWRRELTESLGANGFSDIRTEYLTFSTSAIVTAVRQ